MNTEWPHKFRTITALCSRQGSAWCNHKSHFLLLSLKGESVRIQPARWNQWWQHEPWGYNQLRVQLCEVWPLSHYTGRQRLWYCFWWGMTEIHSQFWIRSHKESDAKMVPIFNPMRIAHQLHTPKKFSGFQVYLLIMWPSE